MATNKSASALRKEVYDFLSAAGFKPTEGQRVGLSKILKSVLEHRVVECRKENDAPLKHEVTCPKCQGVKIMRGRNFKVYKKNIKKAGGVV